MYIFPIQYGSPLPSGYTPAGSVRLDVKVNDMDVDLNEERSAQIPDASCANLTPDDTSCTFYITEDANYSVVLTESNEFGNTTNPTSFICK